MIPTEAQVEELWNTYNLPPAKRRHVTLVSRVAGFLADRLVASHPDILINKPLLVAAALLHDIDKNIPKLDGERHPDTGVRVLRELGMIEISDLVKSHPLHLIIDPATAPSSWEEKLLFLADKMVKYDVIDVDKRFALWRAENLPAEARQELEESYPKVKQLEKEIFSLTSLTPAQVAKQVSQEYTDGGKT